MKKVTCGAVVAPGKIQNSHVFQEAMANSEELREVLTDVGLKVNKMLLTGNYASRKEEELVAARDEVQKINRKISEGKPFSPQEVYKNMSLITRKLCSETFYDWHEYDLDTIIPMNKINAALTDRRHDGYVADLSKDELETNFTLETYGGSAIGMHVLNELYTGNLKNGDKASVVYDFTYDEKYGKMVHSMVYKHDEKTGKDLLVCDTYNPLEQGKTLSTIITVKDIINISKEMASKPSNKSKTY